MTNSLIQRITELGGIVTVKSALNPALWLTLISLLPVLTYIVRNNGQPPTWAVVIACIGLGISCIGYLFLLFFDRDKLQSENYQIRKRALELIQEKGQDFPMVATSIDAISNPSTPVKSLPSDNEL